MTTLAFIGAGRMASAMVKGLLARDLCEPTDIACTCGDDPTGPSLARATGIRYTPDTAELLAGADTAILACKPQQLAGLPREVASHTRGSLILSILAGIPLARLAQTCPEARNIVRAMPNTPGQIGAGITAYCSLRPLSEDDHALVLSLLGALGHTVQADEDDMDAITAISGSGPAYIFEFTAALREAALQAGLPLPMAEKLARATLSGSARLLEQSNEDPEALRNAVTSPGGTTEAALKVFRQGGLRALVNEAVLAARQRSSELSRL